MFINFVILAGIREKCHRDWDDLFMYLHYKNLPLLRGMKPFYMIKHANAIEKAILDQQEHFFFS